jgi:DNA-directed RNA polymerase specialized sigma24 family protein
LDEGWVGQMHARLELARIVRKLRDQHGSVLMLRAAGYEWEDVGQMLGKSSAAVRIGFWREIHRIRRTSSCRR